MFGKMRKRSQVTFKILAVLLCMMLLQTGSAQDKTKEQIRKDNNEKYGGGAVLKTDPELEEIMKNAELFASEESFRNACLLWQRVLERSGDALFTEDGETYFSLRREVERRISKLPEAGLRVYRVTADGEAKAILAAGKGPGDPDALAKVVNNFFLSSLGDKAAFDLGCISLDEHDFVGASLLFNKIVTEFPNPTIPLDQVYLRLAVSSASIGDMGTAKNAIEKVKEIGSTEPKLLEVFEGNLEKFAEGGQITGRSNSEWTIDFGGINRKGAMPAPPENVLSTDLTPQWRWSFDLPTKAKSNRSDAAPQRISSYGKNAVDSTALPELPKNLMDPWKQKGLATVGRMLISDKKVIFKTANDIICWDSGARAEKPTWRSLWLNHYRLDAMSMRGQVGINSSSAPAAANRDQTFFFGDRIHQGMTIDNGVLYTIEGKNYSRFGTTPSSGSATASRGQQIPARTRMNRLTAYDIETGKLVWHRNASDPLKGKESEEDTVDTDVGFMGSPVPYGNLLLCPVTVGGSIWVYGIDKRNQGKTVWKSYLCDEPTRGTFAWSPIQIAIEGRDAYVVCGTGAVFALDAISGSLRFARRYKRDIQGGEASQYNVTNHSLKGWKEDVVIPYGNALVIMASDHEWIFAIDRRTAEFLWKAPRRHSSSGNDPAMDCLGVIGDRLVCAGKKSVICYDLSGEGKLSWVEPLEHTSYGRGFVCDMGVFVPEKDSITHRSLETGKVIKRVGVRSGTGEPVGNLFCDGEKLWVFGVNQVYALTSLATRVTALDKAVETGDLKALLERMHLRFEMEKLDESIKDFSSLLSSVKAEGGTTYDSLMQDKVVRSLLNAQPAKVLGVLLSHGQQIDGKNKESFTKTCTKNSELIFSSRKGIDYSSLSDRTAAQDLLKLSAIYRGERALQEKIKSQLDQLATKEDVPVLKKFVESNPNESMIVLGSLSKLLGDEFIPVLESLVDAKSEEVRFYACRELADVGNAKCLSGFVSLLNSDEDFVRSNANSLLKFVTRHSPEGLSLANEETRNKAMEEWNSWLAENEDIELQYPLKSGILAFGRTVICIRGKLRVYDNKGKRIAETKIGGTPIAVQGLSDGNVLYASDKHIVILGGQTLQQIGQLFRYPTSYKPTSVTRFENGNTLVSLRSNSNAIVVELDEQAKEVWKFKYKDPVEALDAARMANGNTLICVYQRNNTSRGKVLEIDRDGKVISELEVKNGRPIAAQRLENGNTLVSKKTTGIEEYTPDNKVVWNSTKYRLVKKAERLESGNTLILHQAGLTEIDQDEKSVSNISITGAEVFDRY